MNTMKMPRFTAYKSLDISSYTYRSISTTFDVTASTQANVIPQLRCVFTCTQDSGVWVCRGNGQQCNYRSPWN